MKYLKYITPLLFPVVAHGQQITDADYLGKFDGLFAPVKINSQPQLLHMSGMVLIDKLENQGYYGTVVGVKHNAYGAINNAGKIIAPFQFDEVKLLDEKDEYIPRKNYCFVVTKLNGKYGAVDTLGNVLCPQEYDEIDRLNPRVMKVRKGDHWGWADIKTGKLLQEPVYDEVDDSYVTAFVKITKNGKQGLAKDDGTVVVAPEYNGFQYLGYDDYSFFGYAIGDKVGIMSGNGRKVTPAIYTIITRGPIPGTFAVALDGKIGFTDAAGTTLVVPQYTAARPYGDAVLIKKAKVGVLDKHFKEIVPTIYDEIQVYSESGQFLTESVAFESLWAKMGPPAFFIARKGVLYNVYDSTGKKVLPEDYKNITLLNYRGKQLLLVHTQQGKHALMRTDGTTIVPNGADNIAEGYASEFTYSDDAAGPEKDDYVAVIKGKHIGLYNINNGKEILPARYTNISWQNPRLLSLRKDGDSSGVANAEGKIVGKFAQYGFHTPVDTNRIIVINYLKNGNKETRLVDLAGATLYANSKWEFRETQYARMLIPEKERKYTISYHDGLLKVWGENRSNLFLDTNGKEVVFDDFSFVGDFWNGLAVASKIDANDKELFGIINLKKEVIYPLTATEMHTMEGNLIQVEQDTLRGVIKQDGSIFIPVKYTSIDKFYDLPYYKVGMGNNYGVLDSLGKMIIPPVYNDITYNKSATLFEVQQDDKFGLLDSTGHAIIPVIYDEMETNGGFEAPIFPVLVKKDNKYIYLDEQGKPLPFRSDKLKGYND
ncbi:MAG: WG repeat-containing protein [Chitinophaga sp.]|uniref:WG repeat-containing protein n=1 Tax=Chitinophaga sp. TaxID=1869181 RepID=UPI0025C143D3|nr:WG repeat-containing protein [Chitinophaga sp.]MBV8253518.1 WG repeat-containing protein [Chitinophaga sp.]